MNRMNSHAAACSCGSSVSTARPAPEYVGRAGASVNRGKPAVRSSNTPSDERCSPPSTAVLTTSIRSRPLPNSATASAGAIAGCAPDAVSPATAPSPAIAAGEPTALSSDPPAELTTDCVR